VSERRAPRFGLSAPQGVFSEFEHVAPVDRAAAVAAYVSCAERAGFDSVWVSDHLHPIRDGDRGGLLEGWTLLAVLGALTTSIRLGQLVMCAGFRNPALLAKMSSTLDVLTGGRLILGLGSGWFEEEFEANGFRFLSPARRRAQLRDTIEIVRRLWQGDVSTYGGQEYSIDEARGDRPLQPSPPVLVGGRGDLTLRLACRHADMTNFSGSLAQFVAASETLRRHCDELDRDFDSIDRTWFTIGVLVTDTEAEARTITERWRSRGDVRGQRVQFAGTGPQIVERLAPFVEAGCSDLIVTLSDAPEPEAAERFSRSVIDVLAPRTEGSRVG
jgi:alkanesulfonate monooxygenase SsuD/methylene tetrahydromethanopterin reductase-like flavin-dependent oxidoreductase (luciferase family)